MEQKSISGSWKFWLLATLATGGVGLVAFFLISWSTPAAAGASHTEPPPQPDDSNRVEVVLPQTGEMARITERPGTVLAYEQARLFAAVSGFLKRQPVDIGDRVKRGQVLAELDVPELEKQVQEFTAQLARANARVGQMQAKLATAKAEYETAEATIVQADATMKSAQAMRRFREKQFKRMQELFALNSIDERLVDETQEHREAAVEAARAAQAATVTAKAQEQVAVAKIQQAEADITEAKSDVQVVQARLEKAQVMVKYATITAPYDGVITQRSLLPNDYVKSASESGAVPLFTIEGTEKMRVVVSVPDRDVPYIDVGDRAVVEIDALPGKKFRAKVSRIARSEDTQTRMMRAEIDLANPPTGKLCQGMYGRVRIVLDQPPAQLSIPSGCLVGKSGDGQGHVLVVRDDHVRLTPVKIASDNGLRVAIESGLAPTDRVVLHPGSLVDGQEVAISPPSEDKDKP